MNLIGSLRISVTPHCNLNCIYCHREGYYETVGSERLTPEEIARVVEIATDLGVRKIKVTGGEPLIRKDIANILRALSNIEKIAVLSLTTNGILLKNFIEENPDIYLDRINVSLDTLRRDVYKSLGGKDRLNDVIGGIKKAVSSGMLVEINTLVLKEKNLDEIEDIIAFANEVGANIQFIELVQTEENKEFYKKNYYPLSKLEEWLEDRADSIERRRSKFDRMVYHIGRSQIVTCKVVEDPEECSGLRCKLLRITADGKIRFFMIKDNRYTFDLLGPLRSGASDSEIKNIFLKAIELSKEIN
jgi:cyclic pyranopterin phosphate synthase